ncbi:MAG: alpha-hydroxy-acid oxidizing enzyme [Rhodospirillaceae bacterium]|nr:alpha-hydroxy-acid oxidizing enzyme [Rhodospirillaceae bacterium]
MVKSIENILTLGEIVLQAHANAPPEAWDYMVGGSETETTLRRNRLAFDELAFRPRVLRDVNHLDTSTNILGMPFRMPVFLAPMGSLDQLHDDAALVPARAAKEFGISSMVSSVCPPGMETVMTEGGGNLMYQLYVRGDEAWIKDHVDQAQDLGYKTFCITVDTAMYGRRERDKMRSFVPTARRRASGFNLQAGMDWDLVARIKAHCKVPFGLKGIATAEDAQLALDHGVDIIYISNHGGRQLDFGRGTAEVLPEIVEVAGGKATIFVDGSVYRGTDVLKAMALGADAVGIGRLCGYGVAAGGTPGVRRVLELLEEELINAMANLGVTSLDQLTTNYITDARSVHRPSVFSAFQLIDIPGYD